MSVIKFSVADNISQRMQMSSVSTQHSYETLMVGVSDECLTTIVTSRLNIAAIDSSEMQALLLYLSQ